MIRSPRDLSEVAGGERQESSPGELDDDVTAPEPSRLAPGREGSIAILTAEFVGVLIPPQLNCSTFLHHVRAVPHSEDLWKEQTK